MQIKGQEPSQLCVWEQQQKMKELLRPSDGVGLLNPAQTAAPCIHHPQPGLFEGVTVTMTVRVKKRRA